MVELFVLKGAGAKRSTKSSRVTTILCFLKFF